MLTRLNVEEKNRNFLYVVINYQITSRHFVSVHEQNKPHQRKLMGRSGLFAFNPHLTCQFPLFVFPTIGSAKATEIVRLALGCFKHANCNEYSSKQKCVDCCAYAKHHD